MEDELRKQRYTFQPGFAAGVMDRIRAEGHRSVSYFIHRWQPVVAWSAAACIALVIAVMALSEGGLNQDALIGVSGFSELELSELLAGY